MLTVTRSVGRCVYTGYSLDINNLNATYDYRIKVHKVTPSGAQYQITKKGEKPTYVNSVTEEAVTVGETTITFLGADQLSDYDSLESPERNKLYSKLKELRKEKKYDEANEVQRVLAGERWVFALDTPPELIIYRDDIIPREVPAE